MKKTASTCVIGGYINWTLLPRQRILKRVTQVEQAPCNDNVVIESHIKTHLEEKIRLTKILLGVTISIFTQQVLEV